ncbi:glycerol-3-phosphate dehydrogenase [Rhodoblastus sp. 17X3]|uniref:glycerol-3-phosphate dehydrogenase n=1 Tax=Rhodoblastus sp. 17X3 TaxID=3047026 RepID=UPI0024B77240|nr:glycerol-3-phosphate dehydrogenase [Rhodoblastus sp. 17X3]MDI9849941.1 glycerol-3-phosphate dehydrogenase [Rhodoblastus sp. 17X3]
MSAGTGVNGGRTEYDLLVIGGGINGCGVARDAAGRGYKVALVEMDDLASGTSSKSTKLIHGGLRYLESGDFRMVREALVERETLWRIAPHLIQPLRFVVPVLPSARPAWLLRLGLFLYDHLGAREKLSGASSLDLRRAPEGAPLKPYLSRAFAYSDCRVDDSRLVVLNARDAADRGADIFTRTRFLRAEPGIGGWRGILRDEVTETEWGVSARLIVNAAGPWADGILAGKAERPRLRLVRGSHIVVPKLFGHDGAYLFQTGDGRIVFAISYQRDFTLIGTTDADFSGAPDEVTVMSEEIAYLCRAANAFFARAVAPEDVVWSFAGLRPLVDDGTKAAARASRDYALDEGQADGAPFISILGGKLTAYRRVAEQVVDRAAACLGARGGAWTASAILPGGDLPGGDLDVFASDLQARYAFLRAAEARRLACAYGTLCLAFLGSARRREDLGRDFGLGLSEAEVEHLFAREWAGTSDDILWRRSKLGLWASADVPKALDAWLAAQS